MRHLRHLCLSVMAVLILGGSMSYGDIAPGPYEDAEDRPRPVPVEPATQPAIVESAPLADVAPFPSLMDRPVPLIIGGVALTAGVVLLGMWIARRGRSTDSQDK